MEGYFSAVHKMEQTVMFPSLLREVSLDEHEVELEDKDLYDYYSLLKNIKQTVKGGLLALNTKTSHFAVSLKEQQSQEEVDLEGLFYYHVSGLYRVLTRLTERAKTVTSRYNQIMGQINHSETSLGW